MAFDQRRRWHFSLDATQHIFMVLLAFVWIYPTCLYWAQKVRHESSVSYQYARFVSILHRLLRLRSLIIDRYLRRFWSQIRALIIAYFKSTREPSLSRLKNSSHKSICHRSFTDEFLRIVGVRLEGGGQNDADWVCIYFYGWLAPASSEGCAQSSWLHAELRGYCQQSEGV